MVVTLGSSQLQRHAREAAFPPLVCCMRTAAEPVRDPVHAALPGSCWSCGAHRLRAGPTCAGCSRWSRTPGRPRSAPRHSPSRSGPRTWPAPELALPQAPICKHWAHRQQAASRVPRGTCPARPAGPADLRSITVPGGSLSAGSVATPLAVQGCGRSWRSAHRSRVASREAVYSWAPSADRARELTPAQCCVQGVLVSSERTSGGAGPLDSSASSVRRHTPCLHS